MKKVVKRNALKTNVRLIFINVALILLSLLWLVPFYWMVTTSIQPTGAMIQFPSGFFARNPTISHYVKLFVRTDIIRWLLNSFTIAAGVIVMVLFLCFPAAYVFSKREFPGRDALFLLFLVTLMIPIHITLLPIYLLWTRLHLLNTHLGLILPDVGSAFAVFMLVQYLHTLPSELIEAARIDGSSELRVIFTIMLPLAKPAVVTVLLIKFLGSWNSFLMPLILVNKRMMNTLPLGLAMFELKQNVVRWGITLAGATIGVLPIIVLFLFMQKFLVQGIALSGLKK